MDTVRGRNRRDTLEVILPPAHHASPAPRRGRATTTRQWRLASRARARRHTEIRSTGAWCVGDANEALRRAIRALRPVTYGLRARHKRVIFQSHFPPHQGACLHPSARCGALTSISGPAGSPAPAAASCFTWWASVLVRPPACGIQPPGRKPPRSRPPAAGGRPAAGQGRALPVPGPWTAGPADGWVEWGARHRARTTRRRQRPPRCAVPAPPRGRAVRPKGHAATRSLCGTTPARCAGLAQPGSARWHAQPSRANRSRPGPPPARHACTPPASLQPPRPCGCPSACPTGSTLARTSASSAPPTSSATGTRGAASACAGARATCGPSTLRSPSGGARGGARAREGARGHGGGSGGLTEPAAALAAPSAGPRAAPRPY